MKIISPRAASGALGVSISATSWGKILGKIGFYSNAYDSTAARARVPGTALTNGQKARLHRAFWQQRHAKSATQTSREIRDPITQNARPLSSPSLQCSEHPTRSR